MNIKKIAEVPVIRYYTKSLGYCKDSEFQLQAPSCLPGYCVKGKEGLEIEFVCTSCKRKHYQNFNDRNNFFALEKSLHIRSINNKSFLDKLGSLFNCVLYSLPDDEEVYNYKTERPFFGTSENLKILSFGGFKCTHCGACYFFLYDRRLGEERTNEQTTFYIDRIWQVDFDYEEFMNNWNSLDHSFLG